MWDLTILYRNDTDWKSSIDKLYNQIKLLDNFKFNLQTLKDDFDAIEIYSKKLDKLYTYGLLRREEDVSNKEILSNMKYIRNLYKLFNGKLATLSTLSSKNTILEAMTNDTDLKVYKPFFESFAHRNLINSDSELSSLYEKVSPRDEYIAWYGNFKAIGSFNLFNKKYYVTEDNLLNYLRSNSPSKRRLAYESVEKFFQKNSNIAATFLNLQCQLKNLIAINSGFENAYDMFVTNAFYRKIEKCFNLIAINKISNLYHVILSRKIKHIGNKHFSYCDLYYVKDSSENQIPFEQARRVILNVLKDKDKRFYDGVKNAFYNNWIFSEKSNQKHLGQRSFSCFEEHPFVTVSWNNNIDDLFTLVHEVFGAVSQWLASKNGKFIYSELSIVKTEFMSFLGTLYLADYLFLEKSIDHKVILDEMDEFIVESFLIPYEYSLVECRLYQEAVKKQLQSEDISNIWYEVVSLFHNVDTFEEMTINRFNWVGNEHLYLEGYDFNYIVAFVLAYNFYKNDGDFEVLTNQLMYGEQLTDEEFFKTIIPRTTSFEELLSDTIDDILERYQ